MWRKLSASCSALVVAALPLTALAQGTPQQPIPPPWSPMPGPWHMWANGYSWHWWAMPLVMLLMIAACVLLMWFVMGCGRSHAHGRFGPTEGPEPPNYSALKILNERFARGEIQRSEYEHMKSAILSAR